MTSGDSFDAPDEDGVKVSARTGRPLEPVRSLHHLIVRRGQLTESDREVRQVAVLDFLVRVGLGGFEEADRKIISGHLFGCEHGVEIRCEATVQERVIPQCCRYNCSNCGVTQVGTLWPSSSWAVCQRVRVSSSSLIPSMER